MNLYNPFILLTSYYRTFILGVIERIVFYNTQRLPMRCNLLILANQIAYGTNQAIGVALL